MTSRLMKNRNSICFILRSPWEDHRLSDLAVCVNFSSLVVAQLFQKVFDEQCLDEARSDSVEVLPPELHAGVACMRAHVATKASQAVLHCTNDAKHGGQPSTVMRTCPPKTNGAGEIVTCVSGPAQISCNTDDALSVSSGRLAQTASTSPDSKLKVCTANAIQRALPNADFAQCTSSCVWKCAKVKSVASDGWGLGIVLGVGVADVVEVTVLW